ncbi:hypothetical protein [Kitasatospora sp. NPDC088548]|uniref:hypothetical protein n=1 Tax=Kitasatospora sp. NPDC088548 TaxID=3364075 RepID=UPI003828DED4
MPSDSWPALHGRPVLRRTVAVGLVLCVAVAAALMVRGVNALTLGRETPETDRDRAELLAGLHPSQHPGAGPYYVPVGAVYTRTADGVPVAYLHYRLGGGRNVGVGDFLRTYDLPAPGPSAPLPPDLAEALGGDEPAEAPELPEPRTDLPSSAPDAPPDPAPTAAVPAAAPGSASDTGPVVSPAPPGLQAEGAGPSECAGEDGDGRGDEETEPCGATQTPAPATPEPEPVPAPTATPTPTPTPAPPDARPTTGRRIYVATVPGGLPGAADIYVRATG